MRISSHPLAPRVAALARGVGDLLLEATCAGCGARPAPAWCASCAAALVGPARLAMPDPVPAGMPPTWAVCAYAGPVRRAIVASKEDGRRALADALGLALGRSVDAAVRSTAGGRSGSPVWLVPVPSSASALRRRGDDPLLRLVRQATVHLRRDGLPVALVPALRVRGRPDDQAGLGTAARAANLAGRHDVHPRWRHRLGAGPSGVRVILLDDIVTTGATLTEAARALVLGGAGDVRAAVVAATQRRPSAAARGREVGEVVPAGLLSA